MDTHHAKDADRYPGIRIAIFNHKGGVGKTTLTANIAAALAAMRRRILLVDSDPQGNLTTYLVEESVVDDLLDNADTDVGATLWSALKPIAEATGEIKLIDPLERSAGVFLLPGDVRLSEFEQGNPRMYSSVHYTVMPNKTKANVRAEIQVRTLSEEIWGEVDHRFNYSHAVDSVACGEQIKVLARVASSCTRLVDSIFASYADWKRRS